MHKCRAVCSGRGGGGGSSQNMTKERRLRGFGSQCYFSRVLLASNVRCDVAFSVPMFILRKCKILQYMSVKCLCWGGKSKAEILTRDKCHEPSVLRVSIPGSTTKVTKSTPIRVSAPTWMDWHEILKVRRLSSNTL